MTADTIPTIDLAPLGSECGKRAVSRAIDAACTDIGFFMVVGHGIPDSQITTARQRTIDFFALPEAEKMRVARPPAKISRGYNWVGDRSLSYTLGQAAPPDLQEAFAFGPERVAELAARVDPASAQMYAPNIWPECPRDFRDVMLAYYDAMSGLAAKVLHAMAMALGVDEFFLPTSSSEPRALRA
jgi:isopenicillin N synthase-like dioxygenase